MPDRSAHSRGSSPPARRQIPADEIADLVRDLAEGEGELPSPAQFRDILAESGRWERAVLIRFFDRLQAACERDERFGRSA